MSEGINMYNYNEEHKIQLLQVCAASEDGNQHYIHENIQLK